MVTANHQVNAMLPTKILHVMSNPAAGDGHFFDRVVGVAGEFGQKTARLLLHDFA